MYKVVVCFRWSINVWSINVQGGCMFQMMEYKCTRWLYVSDGEV